ncbi:MULTISPECIES: heme-degrading domain-containing protein [Niveibacterium]|uniref:UPF0303 protein JY500_03695 n=1 Tax=Niveibacterium microcysteis TaxID=2811415 RepID=A0ABX7M7N6_9RHOO|nr:MULTISPECIES: heme-degrading domain-containing protein [Niveibacterium]QSI77769.1 heme-degrading domain-containing protein [Niveibacterium microcysteis]
MDFEHELEKLARQEEALIFPAFDEDIAWRLGEALRARAKAAGQAVTIVIRRGEDIVFLHAMPGTSPANADWARRKHNVVTLMQRSSYAVSLECRRDGKGLDEKMGLPLRDYAWHGGCFPIRVAAAGMIGTVTVSGLPQRADHELVVAGLAQLLGHDEATLALD